MKVINVLLNLIKDFGLPVTLRFIIVKILKGKIKNFQLLETLFTSKEGLEIGGPSRIFKKNDFIPIYDKVGKLDGCNFSDNTIWEGSIKEGESSYLYSDNKDRGYQYLLDASDLSPIPTNKYDFVVSTHCLEHVANPFKALTEWLRVLKEDGIFLLILPHRDATFDRERPITSFNHLLSDFENKTTEDDLTHVNEVVESQGDSIGRDKLNLNFEHRMIHHHVFDTELVIKIFDYFGVQILDVNHSLPYNIIVLGQKTEGSCDNSKYMSNDAIYKKTSPFKTDRLYAIK